jgi:hypothetical protein
MLTNICPVCDSNVDANRVILVLRNGIVQRSDFVGSDEEAAGEDRYWRPHGIHKRVPMRADDSQRLASLADARGRRRILPRRSYEGSNSELLALLSQ